MKDAKFFLLSSYWGPVPLATTTDTATMALSSFSVTQRAGTSLHLLASIGDGGGPNHATVKQTRLSSLLLFHAYMQSHSFRSSNLVLAVPSTEILKWKTDFHTSKHFT